jgi:hypothetical protein
MDSDVTETLREGWGKLYIKELNNFILYEMSVL